MSRRALLLASLALSLPASWAHAQSPLVPPTPAAPTARPPAPPPPGRAPEQCGMTEATADYGELEVGSVVTLQRHRMVRGDDNWDPDMDRLLGRAAHVTRLTGVDERGCAGVRVDLDGGQYFWRVRDLGIGTGLQPLPAEVESSAAFPQNCHQSEMAPNYGAATIGATVVLGRHRAVDGDADWAEEMQQWVGRSAHVVQLGGLDTQGCPGVRVDIDGQAWFWRIRDLRAAGDSSTYVAALDPETATPSLGVTTDHGRPTAGIAIFGTGGTPGPQACGLTEGQVVWDPIALGAQVTLGRHRPVNGDENWDPTMDTYVGGAAHVTMLAGVDDQGCPVVRVDLDGGTYVWRVRDMTVTAGGSGPTTPGWSGIMAWPTACGSTTPSYGPVHVGSRIVLGAHSPYTGPDGSGQPVYDDTNWADEMAQYVGMTATVTELSETDGAGCTVVRVDVDGSQYFWRLRDAQPAP